MDDLEATHEQINSILERVRPFLPKELHEELVEIIITRCKVISDYLSTVHSLYGERTPDDPGRKAH